MQHREFAQKFVTTAELCDRYRVSSRTLVRWRSVKGFPAPAMHNVGAENLYLMGEVETWEADQIRKKA